MRRAALLVILAAACRQSSDVPTFKVEAVRFSRQVTADGNLKSTKATQLSAPHGRSDHPSRDHAHPSPVTVEIPVGGLSPLPPLIDPGHQNQDRSVKAP